MSFVEVTNLTVSFPGIVGGGTLVAVDGVSFRLERGESLGLVGESGSGKSTLANALVGLVRRSGGQILVDGHEIEKGDPVVRAEIRRKVQIVFQDSAGTLNPRLTVGSTLEEVLRVHKRRRKQSRLEMAGASEEFSRTGLQARRDELLALVGLDPECASRYPHELSGGQRQRVGIARALAVEPELLVADEPVSALDVSVQAQILNLLQNLRKRMGLAYLLISHDLAVVRHMCQRVMVMYRGKIVECAPAERLFSRPCHPYTEILLSSIPDVVRGLQLRNAAPARVTRECAVGGVPSWFNGCALWPRCPRATERCRVSPPPVVTMPDGGFSMCHLAREFSAEQPESA